MLTCLALLSWTHCLEAQQGDDELILLLKLDSTRNASLPGRYFAGLYFETTERAIRFYENAEAPARDFIRRFEARFAGFFFRATEAYRLQQVIPTAWQAYFSDTSLSPLQYQLLGINAHINGDIWQALTAEFSAAELKANRKNYLRFNKGLSAQYRSFYERSVGSSAATKLLDDLSFGLSKFYGRTLLLRWRKRQLKMAFLYFSDREKFGVRLTRLNRQMAHINRLVLRHL